ncbi:squalene synthase HpnC [Azoarcus taiwanensis]|uniref:Squalene synthase HpnC n=1 Tax=Azoarcus taiwanensis TaxID=666964 RepID=A0A972FDF6_9RHOO|nr:squalene synthase HpnC [Azoarcus taiwanensis]NMG03408.1 squalene synthase HpnC [Azoarcus taiwanensis]
MPVDHYENFPVASILLPARLREPVEAIYAFARSADDIADEGEASAEERLAALNGYRVELDAIEGGHPVVDPALAPIFRRLADNVRRFALPLQPMRDLLDAFSQDVVKTRYATFVELLDYCGRSANPVGRLLLHLYERTEPDALSRSDAICTSLQLINFWQDVAVDWGKGRVYLPAEDLARFGVSEADIAAGRCDDRWRALLGFEVERAREMMHAGAPLATLLPGRIGLELRLIVCGGLRILERIEAVDHDVFQQRPTLGRGDWLRLLWRALAFQSSIRPTPVKGTET